MSQVPKMRLLKRVINLYDFIESMSFFLHPDDLVFAGVALTQTLHPQFAWPVATRNESPAAVLLSALAKIFISFTIFSFYTCS